MMVMNIGFFGTCTSIDGKPKTDLPPKTIELTTVDFSTQERDFYIKIDVELRSQFKVR